MSGTDGIPSVHAREEVNTVHGYIALANPLDDNAVTKLGL